MESITCAVINRSGLFRAGKIFFVWGAQEDVSHVKEFCYIMGGRKTPKLSSRGKEGEQIAPQPPCKIFS